MRAAQVLLRLPRCCSGDRNNRREATMGGAYDFGCLHLPWFGVVWVAYRQQRRQQWARRW